MLLLCGALKNLPDTFVFFPTPSWLRRSGVADALFASCTLINRRAGACLPELALIRRDGSIEPDLGLDVKRHRLHKSVGCTGATCCVRGIIKTLESENVAGLSPRLQATNSFSFQQETKTVTRTLG